jgi:hypothetical protein
MKRGSGSAIDKLGKVKPKKQRVVVCFGIFFTLVAVGWLKQVTTQVTCGVCSG